MGIWKKEYLIVTADSLQNLEHEMNEAAFDGWEVVTTNISKSSFVATMEREKA